MLYRKKKINTAIGCNSHANLLSLPSELLSAIFEQLYSEYRALRGLCLACRSTEKEATRFLYASITFDDGLRHYKFLTTLCNNPKLAELVKVYHLPQSDHPQGAGVWRRLWRCLRLMRNLKELAVDNVATETFFPSLITKDDQDPPFQLQRFIWNVPFLSVLLESQALKFLETQHELTYLQWGRSVGMPYLSENLFKNVKTLDAEINVIRAILPGRSIKSVCWRLPKDETTDIESFLLIKKASSLHSLAFASSVFSSVCNLRLKGHGRSFRFLEVMELDFIRQAFVDIDFLSELPRLKKIVISPRHHLQLAYPSTSLPLSDLKRMVPIFFSRCLGLRYVDIFSSRDMFYHRWIDGRLLPSLLFISPAKLLEVD